MRKDTDLRVTGFCRLDAAGNAKDPVCNGAVGIVVVGIHIVIPEGAVGLNSVPVLPGRGGSPGNGIQPTGILPAKEQGPGDLRMPPTAELMQEVCRSDHTGLQLHAAGPDLLRQAVGKLLRILGEAEMKRQHLFCLRIQAAGETRTVRPDNPGMELFKLTDIPAQQPAGPDHDLYRIGIEGAADQVIIAVTTLGQFDGCRMVVLRGVQGQPVPVGEAAGPQVLRR